MYPMNTANVSKNKDAAFRVVDEVAVVVNPESGMIYVLNEMGTYIWQLLQGTITVNDICNAVHEAFEASKEQISADVQAFLGELAKKQLIVIA
jgi:hypothetical protein